MGNINKQTLWEQFESAVNASMYQLLFLYGFSLIVLLFIYYAKVSPWLGKRVGLKMTKWFDKTINAISTLAMFLPSPW